MERLKRSFRNSFRRKKSTHQTESSKPHQWDGDEIAVRNGNCSFPVKYLGCVQVQDSRGMHICEQALLTLKLQKGKSIKGLLYVSGDGLRVVDDETKGLIVDQTIEKVSFCAPDRNHDRGFSYICRDGTTRRWMCHGFLAIKDTGDRLSHAVGCSFAVCLERKQKRDAKLADIKSNTTNNNSSLNSVGSSVNNSSLNSDLDTSKQQFNRTGSFRRLPLKQRMKDPQEAILIEPIPVKEVHNPYAIERPHATPQLLERQGSCRIFKGLNQNSPFKRQLSLRFTPRELERNRRSSLQQQTQDSMFNKFDTPINNFNSNQTAPTNFLDNFIQDKRENNDLSAMCKYMTDNLTMLSNKKDPFEDNFQLNQSPTNTKTSLTSINSKTPTPDSLTNNSIQNKTIISVESNSLFNKSFNNSSKSSSPIPKEEKKEKPKFGQLSSYSDDFFSLNRPSVQNIKLNNYNQSINNNTNGVMFTDLDKPFKVNFDQLKNEHNVTKINVDSDQSSLRMEIHNNDSMNRLNNSLASSLNSELNKTSSVNKKINHHLNENLISQLSMNNLRNQTNILNNLDNQMNNLNNQNTNQLSNSNYEPLNINSLNNKANRKTNNNNLMNSNKKLNDKELFDPFNAEWVSLARSEEINTNPFLQNLGTVKAFELKM